jgi:Putative  PD-(D/E)XK family member, (DUF4420)
MTSAAAVWKSIASDSASGSSRRLRRVLPDSRLELWLGIGPEGDKLLSVELTPESAVRLTDIPSGSAIAISIDAAASDRRRCTATLRLTEEPLSSPFSSFVDELLERLGTATPDEAGDVLVEHYRSWRELLGSRRPGLTPSEAKGLWGELWLLSNEMIPRLGDDAVGAWTALDGTDHDFETPTVDIEVKTTESRTRQVTITSPRQLETGSRELLLAVLTVDSSRTGEGLTLADLIRNVHGRIERSSAKMLFSSRVNSAVDHDDEATLSGMRYTLRSVEYFRVDGDFPRLRYSDLPRGVVDVRFAIDLATCRSAEVLLTDLLPKGTSDDR